MEVNGDYCVASPEPDFGPDQDNIPFLGFEDDDEFDPLEPDRRIVNPDVYIQDSTQPIVLRRSKRIADIYLNKVLLEEKISEDQKMAGLKCTICQSEYDLSENVSALLCTHVFHRECVAPWILQQKACPLCRRSYVIDNYRE